MKRWTCSVICFAAIAFIAGCQSSTTTSIPIDNKVTATEPTTNPVPAEVALEIVNCDTWKQSLTAHKGRIVVVDTWATWCMPCREEFPKLLELEGKYSSQGVTCMSVSVDELDQKENALKFLKDKQAKIPNFLIDDKPMAWWDHWEIKGIPVVLVFGRDGQLVRKFDNDDPDNQFTYEDVEKQVKELLQTPVP